MESLFTLGKWGWNSTDILFFWERPLSRGWGKRLGAKPGLVTQVLFMSTQLSEPWNIITEAVTAAAGGTVLTKFTIFDCWYQCCIFNILLMCLLWEHFQPDYIFKDKFHGAVWAEWCKINCPHFPTTCGFHWGEMTWIVLIKIGSNLTLGITPCPAQGKRCLSSV